MSVHVNADADAFSAPRSKPVFKKTGWKLKAADTIQTLEQ